MANKRKVHLDATKPGDVGRTARCGFLCLSETETDITKVTCELCRRTIREDRRTLRLPSQAALTAELRAGLLSLVPLAPNAGPPPILSAANWGTVCRSDQRRCGSCIVCEWEREAERWAFAAPWQRVHHQARKVGAPRWGSLNAALVALAEYEAHERTSPSAFGFMLARVARGDVSNDNGASRPDDPQLARADDVVHVRQALAVAYPEGAHKILTARQCMVVLLARTPGAQPGPEIAYEAMAERLSVSIGDLRALVKEGRRRATVELAARGLIPQPPPSAGLAEAVWARGRRVVNG